MDVITTIPFMTEHFHSSLSPPSIIVVVAVPLHHWNVVHLADYKTWATMLIYNI